VSCCFLHNTTEHSRSEQAKAGVQGQRQGNCGERKSMDQITAARKNKTKPGANLGEQPKVGQLQLKSVK
jgi:hypothetical protein